MSSLVFSIPEGLRIPFDRSGKAVYKMSPHHKVTIYEQKDPPKKADLSKQFFVKKRIDGTRRRRSKPVSSPWQDEAEAEFRRVFGKELLD